MDYLIDDNMQQEIFVNVGIFHMMMESLEQCLWGAMHEVDAWAEGYGEPPDKDENIVISILKRNEHFISTVKKQDKKVMEIIKPIYSEFVEYEENVKNKHVMRHIRSHFKNSQTANEWIELYKKVQEKYSKYLKQTC